MLTQHLGWRSIFAISVFLGVAIVILIYFKLKGEWVEADGDFWYTRNNVTNQAGFQYGHCYINISITHG